MSDTHLSAEGLLQLWADAVAMAWTFAKAERLGELRGRRPPRFDARGLHSYSTEWGRILAFEVIMPELANIRWECGVHVDMVSMRRLAHIEAYEEFVRDLAEDALRVVKGKT